MPYQGVDSDIPDKWHLCDGTNNTPDLRNGEFLEASSTAKNRNNPALPNIKGEVTKDPNNSTKEPLFIVNGLKGTGPFLDSPFAAASNFEYGGAKGSGAGVTTLYFDAHNASSIYKDGCTTVQPKSYTVRYIMKIKA